MASSHLLASIGALAAVAACAPHPSRAPAHTDTEREIQAVRAVWDEASDALTARDWGRYARLWVQDSTLQVIHPSQRDWITGWETFAERYQALFTSDAKWTFETRRFDGRVGPSGDVAWAAIENVLTMNGRAQPAWQVAVFRKVQGEWKIALGFSASVPAAPPAPSE